MTIHFEGKVAIVTGGGQGIGETYAKSFADQGAAVVIAELNEENGQRVANEICEVGGKAIFVKTDVSSEADALTASKVAKETFGGIDILINNAAIYQGMRDDTLRDVDMDYYYTIMKVNMHSPLIMTRAVVPYMEERGGGSIINQSSTAAWKAQGGYYGIAKLGVQGLTMCLAGELGSSNIRVNSIAPGYIETNMTNSLPEDQKEALASQIPMGRLGTANEVADTVLFLAGDSGSYITGQTLHVYGGMYTV